MHVSDDWRCLGGLECIAPGSWGVLGGCAPPVGARFVAVVCGGSLCLGLGWYWLCRGKTETEPGLHVDRSLILHFAMFFSLPDGSLSFCVLFNCALLC